MIPTMDLSFNNPSAFKNSQDAAAEMTEVAESSIEGGPTDGLANLRRTPRVAYEDSFTWSICVTDADEFGLRSRMVLSPMMNLSCFHTLPWKETTRWWA